MLSESLLSNNGYNAISIILSIAVFGLVLFYGITTDILRETKGKESKYSFSKFQSWLWTLIIGPVFILHWGLTDNHPIQIGTTELILLSISYASLLTAFSIKTALKSKYKNQNETSVSYLKFDSLAVSQGFITDILTDDNGEFSIGRLQNFMFTIIFVVIYLVTYFSNISMYPVFETYVFTLMGISTSGYLVARGMRG